MLQSRKWASVASIVVAGASVWQGCADTGSGETVGSSSQALMADLYDGTSLPAKTLALTFDDGPGNYATYNGTNGQGTGISQYLKSLGIQAAFFDNGARIKATTLPNPNGIGLTSNTGAILTQVLADGHLIGNHTTTHRDMVTEVLPAGATQEVDELSETDSDLAGYFPSGFLLFRAPYGSYNSSVYADLKGAAVDKYVGPVQWDMGGVSTNYPDQAADWACWQGQITNADGSPAGAAGNGYLTTAECAAAYLTEIHATDHGVILMHEPYYWENGNTLAMVKLIVPQLIAEGYSFVRVDQVPAIRAALPACDPSCATCSGTGASMCLTCPNNFRVNSSGACVACATCSPGTFLTGDCTATTDTVCTPCAPGFYSAAGATSCSECGPGQFSADAGSPSCTTCPLGTLAPNAGSSSCGVCPAGSFAPIGGLSCSQCGPGTFAVAGDAGALALDGGATGCQACPAGSSAPDAGASQCQACAGGTSAPMTGQTSCSPCAAGSVSDGGASACTTCTAGSATGSSATSCVACPTGTFATAGSAACTACAPGQIAADAGAAACTECSPGSYASTGMTACVPCVAGTFAASSGAAMCTPCGVGTTSTAGATNCTAVVVDAGASKDAATHDATTGASDSGSHQGSGGVDATSSTPITRDAGGASGAPAGASSGCSVGHARTSTSGGLLALSAVLGLVWRRRRRSSASE